MAEKQEAFRCQSSAVSHLLILSDRLNTVALLGQAFTLAGGLDRNPVTSLNQVMIYDRLYSVSSVCQCL